MSAWIHNRKGLIEGEVVREDDVWLQIRLASDHRLRYNSDANYGRVDAEGDILTVRKSFLTAVE